MKWLNESNRYKHLLAGLVIGILSCGWWCAGLAGIVGGGACEYKDYMYHGRQVTAWDWLDFGCTIIGAFVGYGIKLLIIAAL